MPFLQIVAAESYTKLVAARKAGRAWCPDQYPDTTIHNLIPNQ